MRSFIGSPSMPSASSLQLQRFRADRNCSLELLSLPALVELTPIKGSKIMVLILEEIYPHVKGKPLGRAWASRFWATVVLVAFIASRSLSSEEALLHFVPQKRRFS